jgi:hypothetical protein
VLLNPLVSAIRRELAAVVRVEHSEFAVALLRGCLMALDGVCNCCLGIKQHDPNVVGGVIDEQ